MGETIYRHLSDEELGVILRAGVGATRDQAASLVAEVKDWRAQDAWRHQRTAPVPYTTTSDAPPDWSRIHTAIIRDAARLCDSPLAQSAQSPRDSLAQWTTVSPDWEQTNIQTMTVDDIVSVYHCHRYGLGVE